MRDEVGEQTNRRKSRQCEPGMADHLDDRGGKETKAAASPSSGTDAAAEENAMMKLRAAEMADELARAQLPAHSPRDAAHSARGAAHLPRPHSRHGAATMDVASSPLSTCALAATEADANAAKQATKRTPSQIASTPGDSPKPGSVRRVVAGVGAVGEGVRGLAGARRSDAASSFSTQGTPTLITHS